MACTPEAQAFVTEGEACQARGAFHEAVRAWQRAIAADDACAAAYAAWGRALAERRLPREAIPKFAAALLRDATVADVWDALGAALSTLDAAGPEIERLRRLVRQIASADAWSRWGALLLEREEWAPAEEAFRSAIAKSATARDNVGLARALHGGGQIPEAASALLRALEIEPGLPEIYETLRRLVPPRRAPADAPAVVDVLARFGAAVDRLGSAAALAQWARVLYDRGQHEAALDAYARAEGLRPLTAADLWARASSLAARDRWDEALVALERAFERVKAGDGGPRRRRFRGRDPLHGMSDERIARLRAFAAGLDAAAVFLELGRFLRTTLDRPDEALEAYDAAARKDPTRSEALLEATYLLSSLERAEEVVSRALEALRRDPDADGDLLEGAGLLTQALEAVLGRADASAQQAHLAAVQTVVDGIDRAGTYARWGAALVALGRVVYAIGQFEKAAAAGPTTPELCRVWARALASVGNTDEALALCAEAIRLGPKDDWAAEARELLAHAPAEALGRRVEVLQAAVEGTVDADAAMAWGQVLQGLGRHEDAMAQFRRTAEMRPDPKAHHAWAEALAAQGRFEEAIEQELLGIELGPDTTDLALIRRALQRIDDETRHIERVQAVVDRAQRSGLYRVWGNVLSTLERPAQAVAQLRRAVEAGETGEWPRIELGRGLAQLERYDEAIAEYQAAMGGQPSDGGRSSIDWNWALTLTSKGQPDIALGHFKRARKSAWLCFDWALTLEKLHDYESAVAMYRQAMDADGANDTLRAYATHNLAVVSRRHGDYRAAADAWKRARDLYTASAESAAADENADFFVYFGWACENVDDFASAERCYRRALELNPKHTAALRSVVKHCRSEAQRRSAEPGSAAASGAPGKIHWAGWDAYHKARRILTARCERESTMAGFVELGTLHLSAETWDEADKAFRRALDHDHPLLGDAHEGLGVVGVRQGRFKEAITHFRRALDRDPSNFDLWSNLAEAHLKAEQSERAEVEYRAILALAPGHVDALVGLGNVYVALAEAAQQASRTPDAEDMFSRSIEQFTRAVQPRDPMSVSKTLDASDRSAALYARGYARTKLFEAQPVVKQDLALLERARDDFRQVREQHENFHKAQRAIRKLDERLSPPLQLAEQWGPRFVFAVVVAVFLAAQVAFFGGCELRQSGLRLTEADVTRMRAEGLPEDVASKLRALTAERVGGPAEMTALVRKALGEAATKFEPLILKHVSATSASVRLLESPSYLTLTFGSLVFMVAALYLQQISKLKFGAIELEKSSGDLIRSSTSLGIGK